MKRRMLRLAHFAAPALLLLLLIMWWQGAHGGRRYLIWTGRCCAFIAADSGHFRVLANFDGRVDALPVHGLYGSQWSPQPTLSGLCFPNSRETVARNLEDAAVNFGHPWPVEVAGFKATAQSLPAISLDRYWVLEIPYWMPASLLGLVVALQCRLGAKALRRHFRAAGICAGCGYDLRATKDRCPECGAKPSPVERVPRERWALAFAQMDLHLRRHAVGYSVATFLTTLILLQALFTR